MKPSAFTLVEIVVVLVIIATLTVATAYSMAGWRMSNRDNRRVADVMEIQEALEQYRCSFRVYPQYVTANMAIKNADRIVMAKVPANPQPGNDGVCTSTTSYFYTRTSVWPPSYSISFCLGGRVGDWGPGINSAIPQGQVTCISNCVMSCNQGTNPDGSSNTGADGCGKTCTNSTNCNTGYTCLYNHCIKN